MFGKYEQDKNVKKGRRTLVALRLLCGVVMLAMTFLFAILAGLSMREGGGFTCLLQCFCLYKCLQAFSDMLFKEPSNGRIFLRRFIGKS